MTDIMHRKLKLAIRKGLFATMSIEKSISSSNVKGIVFIPTDKKYYYVEYTKWSSYMSNVRGMGSLAGKIDIDNYREISSDQAVKIGKDIQARGGSVRKTYFAGIYEKIRGSKRFVKSYSNPEVLSSWS